MRDSVPNLNHFLNCWGILFSWGYFRYYLYLFSMSLRVETNRLFSSIQEFSFIKEIGIGSFGAVKLALHLPTNKCYAAKVIHLTGFLSENQLLLLERQINLHSTINHPHIVKLWDTLIEEETVYMIMELAENGTLFGYQTKNKQISEAEAFKFFSQSLAAVSYLHSHDLMHRDIKPENILLDSAFNVKLCDLGWATDNIQMKRRTFCGTYEYMAPQMIFEQQYNYSIDVWALGILLYQLLHGYAPFNGKSLEEMREKIKLGYYQLGINLRKDAKDLVIEILQFQAELRPSLSDIAKHAWMERTKREIRGELGKIQKEMRSEISNRDKVQRQKQSQFAKKHKRFESLVDELRSRQKAIKKADFSNFFDKLREGSDKKLLKKKKCKTQGQESIQKLLTESGKAICGNYLQRQSKLKKENQCPSQLKLTTEVSKTTFTLKKELAHLKMKRMQEKISELSSQEKRRGNLKYMH